nr:MAG TPA: hypothetical protein [Caudoviricetes sp.]DAY32605.1 MAG TPA: hypothetical protein [Caudoviricetes sp.]
MLYTDIEFRIFIFINHIYPFSPCVTGSPLNAKNTRLGIFVSAEAINCPFALTIDAFDANNASISFILSFV